MWIFIIIEVIILWTFISWIREINSNSKKYLELKPKLDNLENSIVKFNEQIKKERENIEKMVNIL